MRTKAVKTSGAPNKQELAKIKGLAVKEVERLLNSSFEDQLANHGHVHRTLSNAALSAEKDQDFVISLMKTSENLLEEAEEAAKANAKTARNVHAIRAELANSTTDLLQGFESRVNASLKRLDSMRGGSKAKRARK